jgi:hypothetical protein
MQNAESEEQFGDPARKMITERVIKIHRRIERNTDSLGRDRQPFHFQPANDFADNSINRQVRAVDHQCILGND